MNKTIPVLFLGIFLSLFFCSSYLPAKEPVLPDYVQIQTSSSETSQVFSSLLINHERPIFAVVENERANDKRLDIEVKNKIETLLKAYGFRVGEKDTADFIVSVSYDVQSSGSVWEANSIFLPELPGGIDHEFRKGWYSHKFEGISHLYLANFTLAVFDGAYFREEFNVSHQKPVLGSALWFTELIGRINTASYKDPLDYLIAAGVRILGRDSLNYLDNVVVRKDDKDFELVRKIGDKESSETAAANFDFKIANERILNASKDSVSNSTLKFIENAGIKVYEKNKFADYFETDVIKIGQLKDKLGINDELSELIQVPPKLVVDNSLREPSGYRMVIKIRDYGKTAKIILRIYICPFEPKNYSAGAMAIKVESTGHVEKALLDYFEKSYVR